MPRDAAHLEHTMAELHFANRMADDESHPEAAMRHFTRSARAIMGEPDAAARPGGLMPGERNFRVSGIFFAAPARDHLILLADHDFPPEQRHLRISIGDSRPGHTVRNAAPVVVPNTDTDSAFRKILKSARMGSAVYAPMLWEGRALGMFNVAAQARNTFDVTDLNIAMLFAAQATVHWIAKGGPDYISGLADALGPWSDTPVDSPMPPVENIEQLRAELSADLERLVRATGAHRAALHVDDVRRHWSVERPCVEYPRQQIQSKVSANHQRTSHVAQWLQRHRTTYLADTAGGNERPALAAPLLRDDGYLTGWISLFTAEGSAIDNERARAYLSETADSIRRQLGST